MEAITYTIDILPSSITINEWNITKIFYLNVNARVKGGWCICYKTSRGDSELMHGYAYASSMKDCIKQCLESLDVLNGQDHIKFRYD